MVPQKSTSNPSKTISKIRETHWFPHICGNGTWTKNANTETIVHVMFVSKKSWAGWTWSVFIRKVQHLVLRRVFPIQRFASAPSASSGSGWFCGYLPEFSVNNHLTVWGLISVGHAIVPSFAANTSPFLKLRTTQKSRWFFWFHIRIYTNYLEISQRWGTLSPYIYFNF